MQQNEFSHLNWLCDFDIEDLDPLFYEVDYPSPETSESIVEAKVLSTVDDPVKQEQTDYCSATSIVDWRKQNASRKAPRWTEPEDILLTGTVLDEYYERHSLKPTKLEKQQANETTGNAERLVWKKIQDKYQVAVERYYLLHGVKYTSRSVEALQKRWKETGKQKSIVAGDRPAERKGCLTKIYRKMWDEEYNKDNVLACSWTEFNKMYKNPAQESFRTRKRKRV